MGLGSGGDEDGSKGGRSDADRLVPTTERGMAFGRGGEESIGDTFFSFLVKRTNKIDQTEREIANNSGSMARREDIRSTGAGRGWQWAGSGRV
jgi:hypothetical protein